MHLAYLQSIQADLRKSQAATGPPTLAELEDSADEDEEDDDDTGGTTIQRLFFSSSGLIYLFFLPVSALFAL